MGYRHHGYLVSLILVLLLYAARSRQLERLTGTLACSESFDNIYLDLSKENGKCRFAENGLGWKPAGGGDAFTLDQSNIGGAQWSRAAKGFEVKILQRNSGIIQLDGFLQEVRPSPFSSTEKPALI